MGKCRKLLVLIALVTSSVCAIAQTVEKAQKQFEMGMYAQAARTLERITQQSDLDANGWWLLARAYANTNKAAESVGVCERIDNSFGGNDVLFSLWGMQLKKLGAYETAERIFSRIDDPDLRTHMVDGCEVDPLLQNTRHVQLVNLPVNTSSSEFCPVVLHDQLIFASSRSDMIRASQVNERSRSAFRNQLFVSDTREGIPSGKPTFLYTDIENKWNSGPVSLSADAKLIAFVRNQYLDGQSQIISDDKTQSIYFSKLESDGKWSKPVAFEYNSINFSNSFPCLTNNGNGLYFASNRPGGKGGWDIYYSERTDNGWTTPAPVTAVNTSGDEVSPGISGEHLYFSSNWHKGLGGFDVFRTPLKEPGKRIENMGGGVNTPSDDYGYVYNEAEQVGYVTSNRIGGHGNEDIYAVRFEQAYSPVLVSRKTVDTAPVEKRTQQSPKRGRDWKKSSAYTDEDGDGVKTIYSIQVAALSADNAAYDIIADKLSDIGEVYKIYFANMVKIRVGSFSEESDARKTLVKVRDRGYPDAFLVKEEVVVKDETYQIEPGKDLEDPKSQMDPKIETEEKETSEAPIKSETAPKVPADKAREIRQEIGEERLKDMPVYRIRIAAYTNPEWFERSAIEDLGTIYEVLNDEWTVFYMGDFLTIEDAEAVRKQIVEAGYSAAQLYTVRNGELIKLR